MPTRLSSPRRPEFETRTLGEVAAVWTAIAFLAVGGRRKRKSGGSLSDAHPRSARRSASVLHNQGSTPARCAPSPGGPIGASFHARSALGTARTRGVSKMSVRRYNAEYPSGRNGECQARQRRPRRIRRRLHQESVPPRRAPNYEAMIAKAQRHGVRVVCLAVPSWIPPSGVSSLEQILHDLRGVNFAGLDLDLEPNELTGVPVVKAFKELVSSMRAYEGASEWPVSIDVNHIYVDDAAVKEYSYCLMCGLESAGVKLVNLMTYVSDPRPSPPTSVRSSRNIRRRRSPFRRASNPRALPVWDSYWSDGFALFYKDMHGSMPSSRRAATIRASRSNRCITSNASNDR